MANEKKPSIYDDRGTIGSSEELDEYGVWVKSEPQDMSPAIAEKETLDLSKDIPEQETPSDDLNIDLPEIEDLPDFDTLQSEMSGGSIHETLPDNDFSIPELADEPAEEPADDAVSTMDASSSEINSDNKIDDQAFDFGEFANQSEAIEDTLKDFEQMEASEPEKTEPEATETGDDDGYMEISLDDFIGSSEEDPLSLEDNFEIADEEAGEEPNTDLSTQLLMKIADELSSIRTELSDLKKEFSGLKTAPQAEDNTEKGFFNEEDDEKISLTGDELKNILNTADFTEESGSDATMNLSEGLDAKEAEDDTSSTPFQNESEIVFTEQAPEDSKPEEPPAPEEKASDESSLDMSLDLSDFGDSSGETTNESSTDTQLTEADSVTTETEEVKTEEPEESEIKEEAIETTELTETTESSESTEAETTETAESTESTEAETTETAETTESTEAETTETVETTESTEAETTETAETTESTEAETTETAETTESTEAETTETTESTETEEKVTTDSTPSIDDDLVVSLDEEGFSAEADAPSAEEPLPDFAEHDTEELKQIRENGADPMNFAPSEEDINHLSEEPVLEEPAAEDHDDDIDLSDAVIDEPDLSLDIQDNPIEEPSLEDISINLDLSDLDTENSDLLEDFTPIDQDEGESGEDLSLIPEGFLVEADDSQVPLVENEEVISEEDIDVLEPEENAAEPLAEEALPVEEEPETPAAETLEEEPLAEEPMPVEEPLELPVEPLEEEPAAPITETEDVQDLESLDEAKPEEEIPVHLQQELKTVLTYLDQLLESLPDDKIEEFAKSEYYDTYKKLFKELGLV